MGLGQQSMSKKFDEPVADESRDHCNSEVGSRQNVAESPHKSPLPPHPRALKFADQKIGIEQEDDESRLNHRSPDTFLHSLMLVRRLMRGETLPGGQAGLRQRAAHP